MGLASTTASPFRQRRVAGAAVPLPCCRCTCTVPAA